MTQMENAYNNVVLTLAHKGKVKKITRVMLEDMLFVELGATKPETISRNIDIMVRLGYLEVSKGCFGMFDVNMDEVDRIKQEGKS